MEDTQCILRITAGEGQHNERKRQVEKVPLEPEKELKFELGGNKEYEVKAIIDSKVYG